MEKMRMAFVTFALWSMLLVGWGNIAQAADKANPGKLIENLFEDVNTRIKADKDKIAADKTHLIKIGNELLIKYVSFDTMAKQILGKNWRKITPDQRERYTAAFRDRVGTTVVSRYDPEKEYAIDVTNVRTNDAGDRAIVSSIVTEKSTGKRFDIAYKMFYKDNWQVYDVVGEGVSVLQSFKTASAEDFRKNGIEHMIAQLKGDDTVTVKSN